MVAHIRDVFQIEMDGPMKSYGFTIVLAGVPDITDDQGDVLFEAECNDGTIVSRDGHVLIDFTRESASLEQAINSAAADVLRAGFQVDHVEVHCPV
jgi:hypothetical protein